MISELNNQIRKRDKEEANKAVEYLLEERNNNPVMSVTEAIDSLIESQLRTIMLTEIRDDYIIKIIDSAHLPEKKSKPSRAIICIIGFFLGLFVAATYIIFNHLRSINK
jgi:capsular polysaccharide biosynthesis protein